MNFLKNYTRQILMSLVLIGIIFSAGFYVGSSGNKNPAILELEKTNAPLSAENGADLAPFWKAWGLLDEKFAPASSTSAKVSGKDKVWGAIAGLAASYRDPYTVFFPPQEAKMFNDEISGSFGGVGMEIDIRDGALTVVSPIKGSPAARAGVEPGDKIIKIGDKVSVNISSEEAVKLIRGDIGTKVTVTFVRKGVKEPLVKTLTRESINIPTIDTKELEGGIFVISLYNFSAVSPNLFRGALREFVESGQTKLILDLRNNPGGYLEAANDMASWFLAPGEVVVTERYADGKEPDVYKSKGYNIFNDNLKFVILVNGGSASASEILAGALREHGKAILVGENTFGKGSVQELVPVTDNTTLKVTVAHWFTPNGISISNGGLKPDIEVKATAENTKDGNDPALNRAVEYLTNGK